ncbi:MAG: dihydroorotate dehydrogenase electron transfer subunit [DPANN group archaeon]|nr:dihydroorotate dehydrogenase electron transfer subunit [DPANN group archaeon]
MSIPIMFQIDRAVPEAKDVVTLHFRGLLPYRPGQFYMVWLPGINQKPYSLSHHDAEGFGITIKRFGAFSRALSKAKKGDWVGFSGPYGNHFTITKGALFVGGGVGMASLSTAIDLTADARIIIGAVTAAGLVFRKRYASATLVTDDGSAGEKGFVTLPLQRLLDGTKKPPLVLACGPEPMLARVLDICRQAHVPCELSLERYMSCGFGICGKCVLGDRMVCYDGPVFRGEDLYKNEDFGVSKREKTGKKVSLTKSKH